MRIFETMWPAMLVSLMGLSAVSVGFGAEVIKGGSPITAETYGPAVYEMPALMWCAIQFVAAITAAFGAYIGGKNGAWMCLIGSTILSVLFAVFITMSLLAPSGSLLFWGTLFLALPQSILSAGVALRYLRGVQ